MTYAIGSDGSVTMPTGYKAQINTWSATLARATQVVTGFGDAGHQRRAQAVSSTSPAPLAACRKTTCRRRVPSGLDRARLVLP